MSVAPTMIAPIPSAPASSPNCFGPTFEEVARDHRDHLLIGEDEQVHDDGDEQHAEHDRRLDRDRETALDELREPDAVRRLPFLRRTEKVPQPQNRHEIERVHRRHPPVAERCATDREEDTTEQGRENLVPLHGHRFERERIDDPVPLMQFGDQGAAGREIGRPRAAEERGNRVDMPQLHRPGRKERCETRRRNDADDLDREEDIGTPEAICRRAEDEPEDEHRDRAAEAHRPDRDGRSRLDEHDPARRDDLEVIGMVVEEAGTPETQIGGHRQYGRDEVMQCFRRPNRQ